MEDLIYRLRKRAEIRRQIATRKSVQEGKPDRIADLLEEAANEIERLQGRSGDRGAVGLEEVPATTSNGAVEAAGGVSRRVRVALCVK